MDSLTVNVVTPNGLVYDHHAKIVVAKTTDGEIGILPKHAPIIVPLAIDERDIDVPRAERAKQRAERLIEEAKAKDDRDQLRRATVALHRAINRINVSKHG